MSQTSGVEDLRKPDLQPSAMELGLTEDEKKRLELPLILGTTYALNQSETKKVSVGLQLRDDGSIQPVAKLQNNSMAGGIVFESKDWNLLQTHLPAISKYFEGGQKTAWGSDWRSPSPIRVADCEIRFTSSFGTKSIAFDRRGLETIAEKDDDKDEGLGTPPKKRRKYSPAIVLQKPSFDGLIALMVCTDERFRRLQRHVAQVQLCFDVLVAELLMYIPSKETRENIDSFRVKDLIKNNFKALKESVKRRLDPSFVEFTFGIVFLELTVLGIPLIILEIRRYLMKKEKKSAIQ